jgi:hypothetical protein
MEKLLPRIEGGGGGGCPILAFGITKNKYVEDDAPIVEQGPGTIGCYRLHFRNGTAASPGPGHVVCTLRASFRVHGDGPPQK